MTARQVQARIQSLANPKDAAFLAWFFKTGPGQYGEGDVFVGVRVPAPESGPRIQDLALEETEQLLHSPVHEHRLAALLILVTRAAKADTPTKQRIYDLYLANTQRVNNWDLVDLSAPHFWGPP